MPPGTIKDAARHFEEGRAHEAEPIARALLKKRPRDPNLLRLLALICIKVSKRSEAQRLIERARKVAPNDHEVLADSARIAQSEGRYAEALEHARGAVKLAPRDDHAFGLYAQSLIGLARYDDAVEVLRSRIEKRGAQPLLLLPWIEALHRTGAHKEVVLESDAVPTAPKDVQRRVLALKAGSLEKLNRHDEAVETINELHNVSPPVHDADHRAAFNQRLLEAWPRESFSGRPTMLSRLAESEVPVFVIGLPRSGTTLVERIIAAHPKAHGAGELLALTEVAEQRLGAFENNARISAPIDVAGIDESTCEQIRNEYLRTLTDLAGRHERIVNKNLRLPQWAGLIGRCYPKARIIATTRNPEDTAVSIWTHPFNPRLMGWTTRLDWIADMMHDHEQLIAHWRSVLPNPWLDVDYDQLVTDPEPHIRSIIDFIGLEWDASCLAPDEAAKRNTTARFMPTFSEHQVRQPINKGSLGRAIPFGAALEPFRTRYARD